VIPQTFEHWKYCIENDCGIELTKQFAAERLFVYENAENVETKKFIQLYSIQHLNNIIKWLLSV
jgi:hypothetical protein